MIPDHVEKLWNWLMGDVWKGLEEQVRKRLKYCSWSIMSDSGKCSENKNNDRNVDSKGYNNEGSDGNEDFIGN
jgi:hypothetical protein